MLGVTHVAIGAAVALEVGSPELAIPLAFASHFAVDAIPHWNAGKTLDKKDWQAIALDAASGLILVALLYLATHNWLVLLGAFFGAVPDAIEAAFRFADKQNNFYSRFHNIIHYTETVQKWVPDKWLSIFSQLLLVAALSIWIVWAR